MLKTEVIATVKKICNTASEELLKRALERLEKRVCEIKGVSYEGEASELIAGEFDDMYHAYLMSEVYLHNEDWDCHKMYDGIFQRLFSEFISHVVRSSEGKDYKWPDWSWK